MFVEIIFKSFFFQFVYQEAGT